MAEQLPVVVSLIVLMVILFGGVIALHLLGRALARAGAPWWVLPMLLLALMAAIRWWPW